jgi:hypothetical protein
MNDFSVGVRGPMLIDVSIISRTVRDGAKETLLNDPGFSNKLVGLE